MRRLILVLGLVPLALAPAWAGEPGRYSPNCSQGESFARTLTWRDGAGALVNLTGYTAKLMIRTTPSATPLLTLTESSGLTLGGAAGTIVWEMTSAQTAALPTGSLRYDLQLTSGTGVVSYLVEGFVTVSQRITR